MDHSSITHAVLAVLASGLAACQHESTAALRAPEPVTVHNYEATLGAITRSTVSVERYKNGQRLTGVTYFCDGSFLTEEASLDREGRLAHGEYRLTRAPEHTHTHVVLDPTLGVVAVDGPTQSLRFEVPSDLPWTWAPLVHDAAKPALLATPLAAMITLRAGHADSAVREIDLRKHKSHRSEANQLLVNDLDGTDLVVVGDDVVSIDRDVPRQWHAWAFDQDLEERFQELPAQGDAPTVRAVTPRESCESGTFERG